MPPPEVADKVFDAIRNERFYIFTHPDWMELVRMRTDNLLRVENPQDPASFLTKLINPGS